MQGSKRREEKNSVAEEWGTYLTISGFLSLVMGLMNDDHEWGEKRGLGSLGD